MNSASALPMELATTGCCVCNGHDAMPVGVGSDFEYATGPESFVAMRCGGCGLVFLNPRPADSELDRIYPATYHAFDFSEEEFGFIHKIRSRLEAKRLLRWCRGLPGDARILDVGAGDGFHLDLLRRFGKSGWHLEGIDTSAEAATNAYRRGLNVIHGDVTAKDYTGSDFDLVFMIMTIEHVADPRAILASVLNRLNPGGRLVIVTDNTGSPDARFFRGGYWGGYHFPRHWNLFDKPSLTKLAAATGFQTRSVKTAVSPVNWTYSLHNFFTDMRAPRWVINRFTLKSPISLAFFTCVDTFLNLFGCGSILHAVLEKPHSSDTEA